jgi:hypothetical protein
MLAGQSLEVYPSMVNIQQFDMWLARWNRLSNVTPTKKQQQDTFLLKHSAIRDWPVELERHDLPVAFPSASSPEVATSNEHISAKSSTLQQSSLSVSPSSDSDSDTSVVSYQQQQNIRQKNIRQKEDIFDQGNNDDFGNDDFGNDDFGNDYGGNSNGSGNNSGNSSEYSCEHSSDDDDDEHSPPSVYMYRSNFAVVSRKRSRKNTVCSLQDVVPDPLEGMQYPREGGRRVAGKKQKHRIK